MRTGSLEKLSRIVMEPRFYAFNSKAYFHVDAGALRDFRAVCDFAKVRQTGPVDDFPARLCGWV